MKYFITILCLFISLNAQTIGHSFYGVGEDISSIHAVSGSLGGSKFISGNYLDYSIHSVSSIWRSNLTKIYFSNSMSFANINSQKFNNHIIDLIGISIPVANKKSLIFLLKPKYRLAETIVNDPDYEFIGSDENFFNIPIAYKSSSEIKGGIANYCMGYSMAINQFLSGGILINNFFGIQQRYEHITAYEIDYNLSDDSEIEFDEIENTYVFNKNEYYGKSLELEFRLDKNKVEFIMNSEFNIDFNIIDEKNDTTAQELDRLSKYGLGLHYKFLKSAGSVFEYHYTNGIRMNNEQSLFNYNSPNISSFNIGAYKIINNKKHNSFWTNLSLKAGGYIKLFDFSDFSDLKVEQAITIGIGLETIKRSTLNLSIRFGERESIFFYNEKFFALNLGLISSEKWFQRRKEK